MGCYSCHKRDDKHKLKFGEKCESCHTPRSWVIWDSNHEVRAGYKLDGSHKLVACESCYKIAAPKGKAAASVGGACIDCHRLQDAHAGKFGIRCESCHIPTTWKEFKTRFWKQMSTVR
jgi:hypothetical protein